MAGRSIRVRSLTCPNCGAKLHWDQDAPVIECRYCQTHVIVETGRSTKQPTTVISTPAPPRSLRPLVMALGSAAVIGCIAIALGVRASGPRGAGQILRAANSTTAKVIATPLASTPEAIAAMHDGRQTTPTTVYVTLSDGPFESVTFLWESSHPDHISSVGLHPRDDATLEAVATRAREFLGRQLRASSSGGHQFSAKGVGFNVSSTVQITAYVRDDDAWKARLEALWSVMKASALGTNDKLPDNARRDLFNLDYPLAALTGLDFEVDIDGATAEVRRIAPAADRDRTSHTIGLLHPWFDTVTLSWNNAAGGKWTTTAIHYRSDFDFKAKHGELAACLVPLLGEPKKINEDYTASTFTLQFRARGGVPWIDAAPGVLLFYPRYRFGEPATAKGTQDLLSALARCGT